MECKREEADEEMSLARNVIRSSSDGVSLITHSGIIEFVNPALSKIFGYTPEQLLGQQMSVIFCEEDRPKVENQVTLMASKQSGTTFEDHYVCVSDTEAQIPCFVTILAMQNSRGIVTSLVLIFRDESVLRQQQEEAEKAKIRSESLLYHILPRPIVVRLNAGEKNVSFTVPIGTIMFTDVAKFSEYAASLTPDQIMRSLSCLFGAFDEAIGKYPMLQKIKLIGDVYMSAGGLFATNEPPVTHTEQMIRFGLDCLQALEDVNVQLNSVLAVRMGVNTGGPLIAGILGSDRPVFDIIGDAINIAARLQSTDIPGQIQISQETYELISSLDFAVEARGEVMLKGKGKRPAYLVRPGRGFSFQISNSSTLMEMETGRGSLR
jgi:PAS domain S-box-containing protein